MEMNLLRRYVCQLLNEERFTYKGNPDYFRVDLPGIGYALGGEKLRFKECQSDVDALMKTPEYLEAGGGWTGGTGPALDAAS